MKRNASIELFRCLCMFGVCLLHALDQGGYADAHRGLDNLMTPSVVGFLFISGWFGIKLKYKGIVKLLGIGIYCALVVTTIYEFGYLGNRSVEVLAKRFWVYYINAWFLWTYLALMLVAPLFEPIFEQNNASGGGVKYQF